MTSKSESATWSRDTGQRIPCLVRCQLTIIRISNIKDTRCKPRLHASVDLLSGVRQPCCVISSSSCIASESNTASEDDHEEIRSWVPRSMVLRMVTLRATGAALKSNHRSKTGRPAVPSGILNIHLEIDKVLTSLTVHSGVSRFAVTDICIYLVNTRPSV